MTSALPPWLKRALIAAGTMDEQGLTRRARIRRHTCGMPCMAGLDAPVAALSAWCDLTEVSALGEALGLCEGRSSYELWGARGQGRLELARRDRWRIAGAPAGSPRSGPVLLSHDCARPVPGDWAAPAEIVPDPRDDMEVLF